MCIFCDIASGKQEAKVIFQDQDIVAFPDLKPRAPVHILIVPKKHLKSLQILQDRDAEIVGKMVMIARDLAVKQGIANAYKLIFNGGDLQVVPHLHLHLLGGWRVAQTD